VPYRFTDQTCLAGQRALGLDAQCSKRLVAHADSFPACLHSEGRNHRKRMTKAIKTSAACYDCNPILAGGDDVVTRSHENLRCTVFAGPAGASPASGASMTSFNSQRQGNRGISWSGTIGTLLVQILVLLALVFAVVRYLEWSSETNQAEFMSATKPSASDPNHFGAAPNRAKA
jgi:hypothetical protein